jgi:hypothetical protein
VDFLRGAAKAVWAAVGPLVIILLNDLADVVETQAAGIAAALVGAVLVYFVPNRGPKAPQ